MLETVIKNNVIFYAMGIVMTVGVLSNLISYVTLRRMVKAASEIGKSNHRLMKLVKAKFEHASMISEKMQNVEAFVNKYIHEYKVFGMALHTWNNTWVKMVLFLAVFGVLGAVGSYQLHGMNEAVFQYGAWTGIGSLLLFLVHVFTDKKYCIEVTKNYMVEYLENVCAHRYAKANQGIKQLAEEEKLEAEQETEREAKVAEEEHVNLEVSVQKQVAKVKEEMQQEEHKLEKEENLQEKILQDARIREILQEFLA